MSRPGQNQRKRKSGPQNPVNRTAELARGRERRSYRLRLFAFGALILVLALFGIYQFWLRDSSLVAIKELEIAGLSGESKETRQIDEAVRTAVGEMTTLHADQDLLDRELARFPRVAGSRIETSLPDKATVTLTLRTDGSVFGDGPDALLIATDGTVLGSAAGQEGKLPLISEGDPPAGEAANDPGAGGNQGSPSGNPAGTTLSGRTLNQALVLGAAPAEIRPFIERSGMSPEGVEVFFRNGPEILFGDATHADQKWRAAAALIADPEFESSSYVDLTVPRRPGVRSEEGLEEVPVEGLTGTSGTILPE